MVQLLERVSCRIFSCGPADSQRKQRLQELKVRMLIRPGLFLALVVGREEELIMIIFRCLFQGNLNESEGAGMGSLRGAAQRG